MNPGEKGAGWGWGAAFTPLFHPTQIIEKYL